MDPERGFYAITTSGQMLSPVEIGLGYNGDDACAFVFSTLIEIRKILGRECIRRIYTADSDIILELNGKKYKSGDKINLNVSEVARTGFEGIKYLYEISSKKRMEPFKLQRTIPAETEIHVKKFEDGILPTCICVRNSTGEIRINGMNIGIPDKFAQFYVPALQDCEILPDAEVTYFNVDFATDVDGEYYYPYTKPPVIQRMHKNHHNLVDFWNTLPIRYFEITSDECDVTECISEITLGHKCEPILLRMDSESMRFFPGFAANRIVVPFSGGAIGGFPEFAYSGFHHRYELSLNIVATEDFTAKITVHFSNVMKYKGGLCGLIYGT